MAKPVVDKYKKPEPVELLCEGDDMPIGSKLSVARYGNLKTLQLFSKHSIDRGASVLIETQDLPALIDILVKYNEAIRETSD